MPLSMKDIEPDSAEHEQKQRRFKRVPMRRIFPNLITLLAICCGITAIRLGYEGRFELAVGAILLASALDALDGRIARMLGATSKFGAELDSLADFVNFTVVPPVLLYFWALESYKALGWVVVLSFALCGALRLARFNVMLDDPDQPAWKKAFFTGIPSPAAALIVLLPLYLSFLGLIDAETAASGLLIFVPLVAFGMVSRIATFSGKMVGLHIRRDAVILFLIFGVLFVATLVSYPWTVLSISVACYIFSIPVAMLRYNQKNAKSQKKSEVK